MRKITDKTSPDIRVNLDRLATYLEKLPADYSDFEMSSFITDINVVAAEKYVQNGSVASCGTAACAVGHGPAAHMFFNEDELTLFRRGGWGATNSWLNYASRVFTGGDDRAFSWMFGGQWGYSDNSVHGAAARIRYFLANGVPEDYEEGDNEADMIKLYAPTPA